MRLSTTRTDDQLDQARADVLARVSRMRAGEFAATPGEPCRYYDYRAMCRSRLIDETSSGADVAESVGGTMAHLNSLLEEARKADPSDRILYRDRIAALGAAAIPAMKEWIGDPRLGAFAVRVLERIAAEPSNRGAVLDVLASADPEALSERVAQDIVQAIDRLGGTQRHGVARPRSGPRSPQEQWPGQRSVSPLEIRFHDAMLSIFTLAGEATRRRAADGSTIRGYWASYFLRGVRNHGGPNYARQLLRAEGTSDGFQRLTDERRLDLTVEALVLRPEFGELFTDDERAIAAHRLARAGYQPPRA